MASRDTTGIIDTCLPAHNARFAAPALRETGFVAVHDATQVWRVGHRAAFPA